MIKFLTEQFSHYWDVQQLKKNVAGRGWNDIRLAHFLWIALAILVGLIVAVALLVQWMGRDWTPFLQNASSIIMEQVPDDLQMTVTKDGTLLSNQEDVWTIGFEDSEQEFHDVAFMMPGVYTGVLNEGIYFFSDALVIMQDDTAGEEEIIPYAQFFEEIDIDVETALPYTFTKTEIDDVMALGVEKVSSIQRRLQWLGGVLFLLVGTLVGVFVAGIVATLVVIGYVVSGTVVWVVSQILYPLSWIQSWRLVGWLGLVIVPLDLITGFRWWLQCCVIIVVSTFYLLRIRRDTENGGKGIQEFVDDQKPMEW